MANEKIKKDLTIYLENAQNFLEKQTIENFLYDELENLDAIKEEINAIITYFKSLDKVAIVSYYKSEVSKIIEKLNKFNEQSELFLLGIEYEYYLDDCYFYGENDSEDIIFEYSSLKMHKTIKHFRNLTETDVMRELYDYADEEYFIQLESLFLCFNNLCLNEVFSDKTISEQLSKIFNGKLIEIVAGMHDLGDPIVIAKIS